MDLKQVKKINNLPKYDIGKVDTTNLVPGGGTPRFATPSYGNMSLSSDALIAASKAPQNQNVKGAADNNSAGSALSIVNGASSILGSFISQQGAVKSEDELLANAGYSNGIVGGVGYRELNSINSSKELSNLDKSGLGNTFSSTLSGVQAGASFGPWGAVIGGAAGLVSGLFGWSSSKAKLRKRINNAKSFADRSNIMTRAEALSTGIQQNYYDNYGDTSSGILYA